MKLFVRISSFILLVLVMFAGQAVARDVLRVAAIPDESPTELLRKFEPLGAYLEQQTGRKVIWTPVNDYAAVVEALAAHKVDLAWLGGFTFVQAKQKDAGVQPVVQRAKDETFQSKFIVPLNSEINALADLKGGTFAFGSPSSTSGHLMPRYFLLQEGIDPDKDFTRVAFSGAHDATVAFVASRRAAAGVLNAAVWDKLQANEHPNAAKVRVLETTPGYFDYNWTVRSGLDASLVAKIKAAFLALDAERAEDKVILDLQRATRFIETKAENYQNIEAAARAAGLLK